LLLFREFVRAAMERAGERPPEGEPGTIHASRRSD